MPKTKKIAHELSSGNVFRDLGLPDPELETLKVELALQIFQRLKNKKSKQSIFL